MSTAINTPKGRAFNALFSHALRACRVADQAGGNHSAVWAQLQPVFHRELQRCRSDNLEFSTLCGAYLAQLEYLDAEWTTEHILDIFSAAFPDNDEAAISGLAYCAFTRRIYEHLLDGGILERALQYDLKGREVRKKLLERIAAAYIWGIEHLDSSRFQIIFNNNSPKELEQIAWVLSTFRHQSVSTEQREHILSFWERCVIWAQNRPTVPADLLSGLSSLATYITTVDERALRLLLAVAPHVGIRHNSYEFLEVLLGLAELNADAITDVLDAMIAAHVPEFDYEDRLQKLLKLLAVNGKKNDVLHMLDRVLSLPGMHELFNELTRPEIAPES